MPLPKKRRGGFLLNASSSIIKNREDTNCMKEEVLRLTTDTPNDEDENDGDD